MTGTADLFADLSSDATPEEHIAEDGAAQAKEPVGGDEAAPETAPADVDDVTVEDDADDDSAVLDETEDTVDETVDETDEETEDPTAAPEERGLAEQSNSAQPQAVPRESGPTLPDRPSSARKGRPSVPSWDDIMFGRRPGRD